MKYGGLEHSVKDMIGSIEQRFIRRRCISSSRVSCSLPGFLGSARSGLCPEHTLFRGEAHGQKIDSYVARDTARW
jgi:hypothetical protein